MVCDKEARVDSRGQISNFHVLVVCYTLISTAHIHVQIFAEWLHHTIVWKWLDRQQIGLIKEICCEWAACKKIKTLGLYLFLRLCSYY